MAAKENFKIEMTAVGLIEEKILHYFYTLPML